MLHLKLVNKFKNIIVDWKINEENKFNFNEYEQYLEKYQNLFLSNFSKILNFKEFSQIINKTLDILFIFNYIENNAILFNSTLTKNEINQIIDFGFNPNINLEKTKNKVKQSNQKGYIISFKISNKYPNINDKVIRVNLNLLDKKYSFMKKAIYNNNLSSLVNAIDKTNFLWSELFINNQISKNDHLFARFTFDIDYKNLCEKGLFWIEKTAWYSFINEINFQLAEFYKQENLSYHYSYLSSIRKININLKNVNFHINKIFIQISDLFMKINKNIYDKNLFNMENEINENDKKILFELENNLFKLLSKKANYLKIIIYITNCLINPIDNSIITK